MPRFRSLSRSVVQVVDTTTLSFQELRNILEGNREVIGAFCYSRNESRIRQILGLDATISYVNQL